MQKQVVLTSYRVLEAGHIEVQLGKRIVDDGGQVIANEYHRTAIEPGTSVEDQMAAVNAHLVKMGWPAASAEVMARLQRVAELEHTPEVVAKAKSLSESRLEAAGR